MMDVWHVSCGTAITDQLASRQRPAESAAGAHFAQLVEGFERYPYSWQASDNWRLQNLLKGSEKSERSKKHSLPVGACGPSRVSVRFRNQFARSCAQCRCCGAVLLQPLPGLVRTAHCESQP